MTRKMKDSGVEWFGEIPEDWKVVKLNKIANLVTGNTPSKSDDSKYYAEDGLMWVKPDNLNEFRYINKTSEYLNDEGKKISKVVPPFTPLVCCIGTIGKIGVSEHNVAFNQQINAVIFNKQIYNWKFGMFYLMSQESQHWYYANGNVVKILNGENQGKLNMLLPNLNEQIRIANYLDNKCLKIDQTIEKEKQLIEKLKEYKQSVITEAVTKGLNPNVKMKNSGVEWIGEIPEKWKVVKLSNIFKERKVKNKGNIETNVLSLSYGSIKKRNVETNMGLLPANFETYNIIENGNIVLRLTDLQNDHKSLRCGLVKERGIITSAYVTLEKTVDIDSNYYYRLLHTFDIMKGFYGMGEGVRQSLKFDGELKRLLLVMPSVNEQRQIADYLDKKCSSIDKLISNKEKLIEKLTEYKKSLIYECVTGKREV